MDNRKAKNSTQGTPWTLTIAAYKIMIIHLNNVRFVLATPALEIILLEIFLVDDNNIKGDAFHSPGHVLLCISHTNYSLLTMSTTEFVTNLWYANISHCSLNVV